MPLRESKQLYKDSKEAYYNGNKTILSDADFDSLEDHIRAQDPGWSELKKTGVPVANKKAEVKHTYFMPSLNKKYPDKIDPWLVRNLAARAAVTAYALIMAKIDGTSLQVTYTNGKPVRLVTRGDGVNGQDVSYLIPHINLPKKIAVQPTTVFRLEAVMATSTFKKKWMTKADKRTKDDFNDARSMVNGLFNRQLKGEPHPAFKDIDLYVLGVYNHRMGEGLRFARSHGFNVVPFERVTCPKSQMSADALGLSERLAMYKKNGKFEADGLVICDPETVMKFKDSKKPSWTIAYKENDISGAVPVVVEKIIYQVSGDNRINIKAYFEPTKIGTVMVKHATLHNAAWMTDRGIGVGAEILVLRSGDVIPKIVGVVKKAKKLTLPSVPYELRGKFFYALHDSPAAAVERIEKFFVAVGIEGMKSKSIAKLYDHGMKTYYDYVKLWRTAKAPTMPVALFRKGLGLANARKLHTEFDRVLGAGVPIAKVMVGSSLFTGVGMERFEKFEKHWRKVHNSPLHVFIEADEHTARTMLVMPGIKEKTADMFMKNRGHFRKIHKVLSAFFNITAPELTKADKKISGPLSGQVVTFTSYRDLMHEERVKKLGAVVDKFSAKTDILLYKVGGKTSTKLDKAREKGVKVCTFDELMQELK